MVHEWKLLSEVVECHPKIKAEAVVANFSIQSSILAKVIEAQKMDTHWWKRRGIIQRWKFELAQMEE